MADAVVLATLSLLAAILLAFLEGVRRRNVPAAVNASVSFSAAALPLVVGSVTNVGQEPIVGSGLALWVGLAGFLHSVGMLGPYDSVRWWDVLTHAVSAALVAALVYAGALVALGSSSSTRVATAGVVGVTVGLTVGAGVFWELIELVARDLEDRYGVDPVLVHYGWRDTAGDLVVDVGAVVAVVALDVRTFVPIAASAPGWTGTLLLGTGAIVALGSLLMVLWILLGVEDVP